MEFLSNNTKISPFSTTLKVFIQFAAETIKVIFAAAFSNAKLICS
jgi:hypothetical protein